MSAYALAFLRLSLGARLQAREFVLLLALPHRVIAIQGRDCRDRRISPSLLRRLGRPGLSGEPFLSTCLSLDLLTLPQGELYGAVHLRIRSISRLLLAEESPFPPGFYRVGFFWRSYPIRPILLEDVPILGRGLSSLVPSCAHRVGARLIQAHREAVPTALSGFPRLPSEPRLGHACLTRVLLAADLCFAARLIGRDGLLHLPYPVLRQCQLADGSTSLGIPPSGFLGPNSQDPRLLSGRGRCRLCPNRFRLSFLA